MSGDLTFVRVIFIMSILGNTFNFILLKNL
jgi:hypothetical protein